MNPKPIFITGRYEDTDATHGGGLDKYIHDQWLSHFKIDLVMSVWDRDVLSLIPSTGLVPPIIGFSWGGCKAVEVCWDLLARGRAVPKLILIDPVPFPDPRPHYLGFDLPDNVADATCYWRGYDNQKAIFSGPIRSARCPYINAKFNPAPTFPFNEAAEHGQYCLWPSAQRVADQLRGLVQA